MNHQLKLYHSESPTDATPYDEDFDLSSPSLNQPRSVGKKQRTTTRRTILEYVRWIIFEEDEDHYAVRIEKNSILNRNNNNKWKQLPVATMLIY